MPGTPGTVDAPTAPTAPWKTLRVFHKLPQGILSTTSSTDRLNHPQILLRNLLWYRLAADQGHAGAQSDLGIMYVDGRGVPQDDGEAVRWYRLAAEQGNLDAQSNLGGMYDMGRGVPQDYTEAVRWYRLAAEQGHAAAQSNLGLMYGGGKGVPQDYVEAHMWFNLAAAKSSGENRDLFVKYRGAIATAMTSEQIAEAQRRAREWTPTRQER